MPIFWSYVFAFFARQGQGGGGGPSLLRWGKGGMFIVAAAAWLLACAVSRGVAQKDLSIGEAKAGGAGEKAGGAKA
jgi:hypothetical protein